MKSGGGGRGSVFSVLNVISVILQKLKDISE